MEKKLSHAYMLIGPAGSARDEAAKELAASLLCSADAPPCRSCRDCKKVLLGIHPDVMWVNRSLDDKGHPRRELLVDQIRAVTADAFIAPNEAERKVYILREGDHMNEAAQNALLKSLEEPPGHACFILCAASVQALLETVRSRCVRVDTRRLGPGADDGDMTAVSLEYERLAAMGRSAELLQFCMMRSAMTPDEAQRFCAQVKSDLCAMLCDRLNNPGLSRKTIWKTAALMDRAEEYLRHNVGTRQVFGVLAAETLR